MALNSKEFIIKSVYDSTGLKKFSSDVDAARAAGISLGASLTDTSRVLDQTINTSFNKAGATVRDVTTAFSEGGKRIVVAFKQIDGVINESNTSFKTFNEAITATVPRAAQVSTSLAKIAERMTELNALNKGFSRNFGDAFTPATKVISTAAPALTSKKITFNEQEVVVPVQKLVSVVETADGKFKQLTQTVTFLPNGMKSISRAMTDITEKTLNTQKALSLLAEKQLRVQQTAQGTAQAAEIEASALAKANAEAAAFAASLGRVAVSSQQAEQGARFFTTGLSSSATLLETKSKQINENGQAIVRTTAIFSDNGKKITTVFDSTSTATNKVSQAMGDLKEKSAGAGIDIGKLISRAAVTIPVWFALRAAITGVFTGIRDGLTNLVSFDLALQKIKRNLSGTPEEITANFGVMKKEITEFSLKTGKSVEEISDAVKQFATIGFNFKDSLQGGLDATRLSILLFGEAGQTAEAFATSLKLLMKTGEGAAPVQQQMAEGFALTAELAKNNKDKLSDLSQALGNVAGSASVAKLSFKETITLLLTLASAGKGGANGATLLSSSLSNLLTNLSSVSKTFGVEFVPGVDSAFTVLTKVLDVATTLSRTPAGEAQVFEKLGEVFGGQRGIKLTSALVAANAALKENLKVTGDIGKFHSGVATVLDSESGQATILGNRIREMGKSFVTSVVGADSFITVIKNLNKTVENTTPLLQSFGRSIAGVLNPNTLLVSSIGALGLALTNTSVVLVSLPALLLRVRIAMLGLTNIPIAAALVGIGLLTDKLTKGPVDQLNDLDTKFQATQQKLAAALKGQLPKVELEQFKLDFKNGKAVLDANVPIAIINNALNKALSTEEVSARVKAKAKVEPVLSTSSVALASLENDLSELKARLKAKGATDIQLSLLDVSFLQSKALQETDKIRDEQSKIRVQTLEKERSIQDLLLTAVEEGAKAEGASNLEAISRRIELEQQLGIHRTGMDLLNQQLNLQKALTEETKKTKTERLDELQALIKKTLTPEQQSRQDERNKTREDQLRSQAERKGISEKQINAILNPEAQIAKGNSLLNDLQSGLTAPMTKSMSSLEFAISSLTQTILKQEISPLNVQVPKSTSALPSLGNALGLKRGESDIPKFTDFTTKIPQSLIGLPKPLDTRRDISVNVGDIMVTVSGEGTADDIAKRVAKIVEDMIAANLVKPGTKVNDSLFTAVGRM